jgi:hypothetical protein
VFTLLVRAESRTLHPFFKLWVCIDTLQGKRDIEPAVQLHSKKELPLLRSENSGANAGRCGEGDSLIAQRIVLLRPSVGYCRLANGRF